MHMLRAVVDDTDSESAAAPGRGCVRRGMEQFAAQGEGLADLVLRHDARESVIPIA
jgi:hypothetical protein